MIVDHINPVHDSYCRCRTCKPSLVGERSDALFRIRVGALGLVGLLAIVIRASGWA